MNLDTTMSKECKEEYKNVFLDHYYKLKRQVTKCPWDEESRDEFNKAKETLGSIVFKYGTSI